MAAEVAGAKAFFGGGALPVPAGTVADVLASLWHSAAEQSAEGELPAVTRVSLGSLVVVTSQARAAEVGQTWSTVSEAQPSRALLVAVGEGETAGFEAAVSAACHVPAPGAPQVCSERVLLSTGRPGLERLPGTVLPLLEPDVPATLWWDLPDPPAARLVSDLVRAFDRVLLELTTAAAPAAIWEALRYAGPALSDLAWFRAGSWREAIAQLFDGAGAEVLASLDSIDVTTAAEAEQLLPAALLGGWAAAQLGWNPKKGSGYFFATDWERPGGGAARVTIRTEAVGEGRPGRLQAVRLAAGDAGEWTLTRAAERPRELLLQAHHQDWCRIPSRLPAPRPDPARTLLAAITAPPHNAMRDRALRRAVWMLGWAGAEDGPAHDAPTR